MNISLTKKRESIVILSIPFNLSSLLQIHHLPTTRSRHNSPPPIPTPDLIPAHIRNPIHGSIHQIIRSTRQMRLLSIIAPERLGKHPVHTHRDTLARHRLELPRGLRRPEPLPVVFRELGLQRGNLIGVRHPRSVRCGARHPEQLHGGSEFLETGFRGVVHLVGEGGADAQFG